MLIKIFALYFAPSSSQFNANKQTNNVQPTNKYSNRMTFIADERFQSFYVENTGLWTLQIKYVQVRWKEKYMEKASFARTLIMILFYINRHVMQVYTSARFQQSRKFQLASICMWLVGIMACPFCLTPSIFPLAISINSTD